MATVGALNVQLGIDTAAFSTGLSGAQARLTNFNRSATQGAAGLGRLQEGFSRLGRGGGIQNAAFQLQDIVVQMQMGAGATRALSAQLPQLLGGFGAIGAVLGAGLAISLPLVISGFQALFGATEDWSASLAETAASGGEVESMIEDLRAAQEAYRSAVAATAGTQSAATDSIVADTRREYEAKLALLRLEVKRQEAAIAGKRARIGELTADAHLDGAALSKDPALANLQGRHLGAPLGGAIPEPFAEAQQAARARAVGRILAARPAEVTFELDQLRAETTLAELALGKLREAAAGTFNDIAGGAGTPDTGSGTAGGGGGGSGRAGGRGARGAAAAVGTLGRQAGQAAGEMQNLGTEVARVAAVNEQLGRSFADVFSGAITGARSLQESLAELGERLAGTLLQRGLTGLFEASGIGGALANLIPGFANGTNFAPGGLAWVGERGPELVRLPRGSQVTPNTDLGRGDVRLTVNVNGARGNAEIMAMAEAGTARALQAYDRALPDRLAGVRADRYRRG